MQNIQNNEHRSELARIVARHFVEEHMLLVLDNLETPDLFREDIMLHSLVKELSDCQNSRSRLLITTCNGQMCRTLESLGCHVQDCSLTTVDNEQHVMPELLYVLSKDRTGSSAGYQRPDDDVMVRILNSVLVTCNRIRPCHPPVHCVAVQIQ